MVDQHRRIGGVAVWGAGAKGVTFAGLVDPQESQVDCVVDINPRKQGRFLPGTGHPIVPPAALRELGVKTVLVLNPNYVPEIRLLLDELNLDVVVIDVMREAVGLSASETLAQRR